MSLEQVFYLSQSIASVAVIGTLIYLGVQIRDTERNQRAIMQQGRADRICSNSMTLANTPELAAEWSRLFAANPQLSPERFPQMTMVWRVVFISGEDSFLQHRSGALDDAAFESYAAGLKQFMGAPGMRAAWRLFGPQYGAEYRAFMDDIIRQVSTSTPADGYALWQKYLSEELGTPVS